VKIEVGDMLPSQHYAELVKRVPPIWDKAFEVNASDNEAVRASGSLEPSRGAKTPSDQRRGWGPGAIE